jgi:hypothetical protein
MTNVDQVNHIAAVLGVIITLWTIPWKIYAVWLAAKHNHKKWFVALVILNTASILEIIYIWKVQKKTWNEVKADFHYGWRKLRGKN